MDIYTYQGELLCEDCGEYARERLDKEGKSPADPDDESTFDSDDYPKGPYPDGGGEADCPQHCGNCDIFLENPLTADGLLYVTDALAEYANTGRGRKEVLQDWADCYDLLMEG